MVSDACSSPDIIRIVHVHEQEHRTHLDRYSFFDHPDNNKSNNKDYYSVSMKTFSNPFQERKKTEQERERKEWTRTKKNLRHTSSQCQSEAHTTTHNEEAKVAEGPFTCCLYRRLASFFFFLFFFFLLLRKTFYLRIGPTFQTLPIQFKHKSKNVIDKPGPSCVKWNP